MLSYTHGENRDTGYNLMPLNRKLARGGRKGEVAVAAKDDVSDVRNETKTAGYGLIAAARRCLRGSRNNNGA